MKSRALACFTFNGYRPLVGFDDALNYRQPQACSLSLLFGCIIGIKNLFVSIGLNTVSGIRNTQFQIRSRFKIRNPAGGILI